jgi:hypothetical protein
MNAMTNNNKIISPSIGLDNSPFALFATNLQSQSHTAPILKNLKQRHGININLLLFTLWFAMIQCGRLSKKEITQLAAATQHWHERILLPLQRFEAKLPAQANTGLNAFIKQWLQTEIAIADQIEQRLLAETLDNIKPGTRSLQQQLTDACQNLAIYCKSMQIQLDVNNQEQIVNLLKSIFPAHSTTAVVKACDQILQSIMNALPGYSQLSLHEV